MTKSPYEGTDQFLTLKDIRLQQAGIKTPIQQMPFKQKTPIQLNDIELNLPEFGIKAGAQNPEEELKSPSEISVSVYSQTPDEDHHRDKLDEAQKLPK